MERREFLAASLATSVAGVSIAPKASAQDSVTGQRRFNLNYAPHFGMFKHHAGGDPIDQLKFIADQGFKAMEDNGMSGRPPEVQERIAGEMSRLGVTMGV